MFMRVLLARETPKRAGMISKQRIALAVVESDDDSGSGISC